MPAQRVDSLLSLLMFTLSMPGRNQFALLTTHGTDPHWLKNNWPWVEKVSYVSRIDVAGRFIVLNITGQIWPVHFSSEVGKLLLRRYPYCIRLYWFIAHHVLSVTRRFR